MFDDKFRRARPIPDLGVLNFVNNSIQDSYKYLYDKNITKDFLNTYYEWIRSSELNNLHGLEKFDNLGYIHGTTQAFDAFYSENKDRRMRCFRGEYRYHTVIWRNNYPGWKYIEDDEIRKNDAVVISLPFSDFGSEHPEMQKVLDSCDRLNVPVLVDCAYYSITKDLNFDLDRPCIDTIAFSMSKAFYGVEKLRIGMRCKREFKDDSVDALNLADYFSKIGPAVGYRLCKKYDPDFNYKKYGKKQEEICKKLKIETSDCVNFGLASKEHEYFSDFERGSDWRRVCISLLLGEIGI